MFWINLKRLKKWKDTLQNGLLWHTTENGWRWRVYDRYNKRNKRCVTFRLLSPDGRAYEQTTYSVNNKHTKGLLSHTDESIAWAIIEILTMKENEER